MIPAMPPPPPSINIKEVSEQYIQQLVAAAKESMGIARSAYFDLIKVMIGLSFAALPILVATVPGLREGRIEDLVTITIFLAGVAMFFISVILGICALGFSAKAFRKVAFDLDKERQDFLKMASASGYSPKAIGEFFLKAFENDKGRSMFSSLNLNWFYGQLGVFLAALVLFFSCFLTAVWHKYETSEKRVSPNHPAAVLSGKAGR